VLGVLQFQYPDSKSMVLIVVILSVILLRVMTPFKNKVTKDPFTRLILGGIYAHHFCVFAKTQ
jgi:hypothetical protein